MVHGQNTPWGFLQYFGGIKVWPSCVLVREEHGYCCNMAKLQGEGACVRVKDQLSGF